MVLEGLEQLQTSAICCEQGRDGLAEGATHGSCCWWHGTRDAIESATDLAELDKLAASGASGGYEEGVFAHIFQTILVKRSA